MELIKCKVCGVHRPDGDFYYSFGRKSDICKTCSKERSKRRKEFIKNITPAVTKLRETLFKEIHL